MSVKAHVKAAPFCSKFGLKVQGVAYLWNHPYLGF